MALDCIPKGAPGYDEARVITNARFDFKPAQICYCSDERDVQAAVRQAKPGKVRIRSGGHHHEGLCSGDDVTIIDVSKINAFEVATGKGLSALAGAGAHLRDVYGTLWRYRRLLPGGGCGDVCVGGLAQGGGWGPYSRQLGLTCDQIEGFKIVLACGEIRDVTFESDPELFWAVCGGGGGNFGVVTHFRFKVAPIESEIWTFTISWRSRTFYEEVTNEWIKNFPTSPDRRLTSFCRLTALAGGASLDDPVVVSGNFLGAKADLERILPAMLPATYAKAYKVDFDRVDGLKEGVRAFTHPAFQPGPPIGGQLSSTCDGTPFPHKISSCFPNINFYSGGVSKIAKYLSQPNKTEPTARRYISLHSFGGAIDRTEENKARSCFAYGDHLFMLQYQAWWGNRENTDVEARCLEWIAGFREKMQGSTVGSFINFPDIDIPINDYYGSNFNRLVKVRSDFDPKALFQFPMSIPGIC